MSKQAVLLIHGIGEQRPMDTLRSFVDSVWTTDTSLHRNHPSGAGVWSKPDTLSTSYELRRLTTAVNVGGTRTDFFECYWAHLMHGNKLSHVLAWLFRLIWRRPAKVPDPLRLLYYLLWLLALLVSAYLLLRVSGQLHILPLPETVISALPKVFGAISFLGGGLAVNFIGDAARYLSPRPENIHRRAEIRRHGVTLIDGLHKRGYQRIIIVGHSLGTVIGYDILNYAWADYNKDSELQSDPDDARKALEALCKELHDKNTDKGVGIVKIQRAQAAYFDELQKAGNKWRITDFITLGSPLAHAAVLMADDAADLENKIKVREYPSCLPQLETNERFTYAVTLRVSNTQNQKKKYNCPHHGAVFGPTRWTNLYFPSKLIIFGDFIAGPVAPVFGRAIHDIKVTTSKWYGLFSHTFYWEPTERAEQREASPSPDALNDPIIALREALNLANLEEADS